MLELAVVRRRLITAPTQDILEVLLRHGHTLASADPAPYAWARKNLHLPVYSVTEKGLAGCIDGAFIQLASGDWRRVRARGFAVVEGRRLPVFSQRATAPPPFRFGRVFLPAPLMAATDLAPVTAGTNDTYIYCEGGGGASWVTAWANARAATAGTLAVAAGTTLYVGYDAYIDETKYVTIYRSMVPFDATGLPDTCTVTAGHIHLNVAFIYSVGITLHQVSFAGSNPMVAGDFDLFGAVSRGSVAITATGAATLALTDFADISPTAASLLGFRSGQDYDNAGPASSENKRVAICSADHATPANRPVLDISYTVPVVYQPRPSAAVGGFHIF